MDRRNGELQNKLSGKGVTFNTDGTIANYAQAYASQLNYVNGLINQYNNMSAAAQEGFKDTVEKTIIPIINALKEGIETDEEIANKTEIKLNIVRKILYKLYDLKIANYKRSKDPETQWFTYTWKFDENELVNQINDECMNDLEKLNAELDREENNMFFVCPEGHVRYTFDKASDETFICDCGEELVFQDNSDIIKQLKDEINLIQSDLDNFNKEIKK